MQVLASHTTSLRAKVSFTLRQHLAVLMTRRALRRMAAGIPWQHVRTDQAARLDMWKEVDRICAESAATLGIHSEVLKQSVPEVRLLEALTAEQPKSAPVVLPIAFVLVRM